jgi:hypothetical protein
MDRKFMHPPLPRTRALVACAGVAAVLLAASPWHHANASPASTQVSLARLYWIFYKEDIERVNAFDPAVVRQLVAGPGVYALTRSAHGPTLPAGVKPAENFFSAAALQQAIGSHAIYPGVRFVAEDPEDWKATPMPERLTPVRYMDKFATIANAHGLTPILVPARDLMRVPDAVCTQQRQDTISQAYISCGIPAAAAKARFYVIQAAAVETNLPALVQLVRQGAAAAHRANPSAIVLATLSAAPNGAPIPYGAVVKAARAILPYVKGFEMNSEPVNDHGLVSFLMALSR